jgi:GNAT superfamily N-acetyltransferase
LYGGDQFSQRDTNYLDPTCEPAKIRAFFVHPEHARKGIGRAILDTCENEARAYGFTSIELMSTLPGIKLYQTCGYLPREPFDLDLGDGIKLELLAMQKSLE